MAGGGGGGLSRRGPTLLLLAAGLLYAALQLNRRWLHYPLPAALNAYLSDVLCLPLILSATRWLLRRLRLVPPRFVLPDAWIASAWLLTSVVFELVLPRLRPATATADWLDVVAYAAGALAYRFGSVEC